MSSGLKNGPLGGTCIHLCVDVQNLFARETAWHTPWMDRVLPRIVQVAEHAPHRTIFTRFVPAVHAGERTGTWRRYYERWAEMTLERMPADMVELVPELARLVPPGEIVDKAVYSPWFQPELAASLERRRADTIVVTGGETDVCVLATVLGAVDRGFRVVIAQDGLCSSSDEAHDASITVYQTRYGQQVEVADSAEILASWAS